MKPSDSQIDPILLQRLVDGELDNEQIQKILIDANTTPDQWQEIAVGFVENLTWSNAFQSKFQGAGTTTDLVENNRETPVAIQHQTVVEHQHPKTIVQEKRISPSPWWVMAASLLVAGAIGFMASDIMNRDVPAGSVVQSPTAPLPDSVDSEIADNGTSIPNRTGELPKMTQAKLTPDYHVEVPQDNEHFREYSLGESNSRVPIYRVTNQKQLNQFHAARQKDSAVPPEILQKLSGSGYQMQTEIEFISGKIGDDESFVIPVRTFFFVPGQ